MPPFLSPELGGYIASYLPDDQDLASFRGAYRVWNEATLLAVATGWFGTVGTDLSPRSMRRLEHIAGHETFRRAVHKIYTGPSYGNDGPARLGSGYDWPRLDSGALNPVSEKVQRVQAVIVRFVHLSVFKVNDWVDSAPPEQDTTKSLSPSDALNLFLSVFKLVPALGTIRLQSFQIKFREHSPRLHENRFPASTVDTTCFRTAWGHIRHLDL